ncbi:MAG: hypothetical protein HY681_13620 [Chloroflexi bacterium]|nr:hypothetical protein [Chloroflexota bacterium]
MTIAKALAVFGFNHVLGPLLRLNLLVWVVLGLTTLVVLGAATGSERLFLYGTFGFVALPFVLGVVAIILLPFK